MVSCVVCDSAVRRKQPTLVCHRCSGLQHRECDTGVSPARYRRMQSSKAWTCVKCRENATERPSMGDPLPTPAVAPLSTTENDVSMEDTMEEEAVEPMVEDQPVVPIYEVVEDGTKRGRPQLVDNIGYRFGVVYRGSSVTWRCTVRPKGKECKAKVVERDGVFTTGTEQHNHNPKVGTATAVKVAARVKKEARSDMFKSATVIVKRVLIDETQAHERYPAIAKQTSLARAANRQRQKMRPDEPRDLDFVLDKDYIQQSFLRGDVRVTGGNGSRHLIFATDIQLRHLANAKTWYLDGTFKLCRPPFTQLFGVNAFVKKDDCMKSVPLIFVLMSRRKKRDYKRVLHEIVQMLPKPLKVVRAMLDFEKALWSAMSVAMPGVHLTGCMFHWKQAVFRKIQHLGLQPVYMQRGEAQDFLRDVISLPHLPAEQIAPVWERLKCRASTDAMQTFTRYITNTWITSKIHAPDTWSVFKRSVGTNNDAEGWHAALNKRAGGKANLPFYMMMTTLQNEAALVHLDIRLIKEKKLSRYQRPSSKRRQERMHDLWAKYERGDLSAEGLLRACHCFAPEPASQASSPGASSA